MKKIVLIEGDTNDADYVTREEIVSEKDIEFLKKIGEALKNTPAQCYHNWGNSDYCDKEESPYAMYKDVLTKKEIDNFNDNFCPYGEHGIHTIESIRILTISEEDKLF